VPNGLSTVIFAAAGTALFPCACAWFKAEKLQYRPIHSTAITAKVNCRFMRSPPLKELLIRQKDLQMPFPESFSGKLKQRRNHSVSCLLPYLSFGDHRLPLRLGLVVQGRITAEKADTKHRENGQSKMATHRSRSSLSKNSGNCRSPSLQQSEMRGRL
jgi:hypothetical protein